METATQRLHRLTSYEPGRDWALPIDDPWVIQDLKANDLSRLPWFVKRYPAGLPRLSLPRELPPTSAPAVAVLAGTAEVSPAPLNLAQLSRLLYLSAGVVRTMERPYGTHPFRAAGSAGGRFPLEVYVAVPAGGPVLAGGPLPAGVHWYDPEDHALVLIGPPPRSGSPAVVVTGVPWRTGWRYRERGYRHIYWDAGTMLAQLLTLADSAGLPAALYSSFPDAQVAALVGADRVHEFPVAVVGLGGTDPAAEPAVEPTAGPAVEPAVGPGGPAAAGQVDAAPLEFPLRTSMAVALRGLDVPHWVVVHDVAGLTPGVYRWPELDEPVRTGALRDELYRVCLDQALARDAAFVAIAAADLAGRGDAGYRAAHLAAHLAAGLAEGRLHLAAYALGVSATGMTFLDSEVPAVLGQALDGVLFTCVGVPLYRSAPGGSPGAPAAVRPVAPAD